MTLVSSFFFSPLLDLGQFHFSSQHFQIFGGGKIIYGEYVVCLTRILPHVVIETLHYYIGLYYFLFFCISSILLVFYSWSGVVISPVFFFFFFCCCCLVWSYLLFGCAVLPSTFHPTSTSPPFISLQCLLTSRSLISLYPESHLLKESYTTYFLFPYRFQGFLVVQFCVCCRCNGDMLFSLFRSDAG